MAGGDGYPRIYVAAGRQIYSRIYLTGEELRASVYPRHVVRPIGSGLWVEVPREEQLARARLLNQMPPWLKECVVEEMREELEELQRFIWLTEPGNF